MQVSFRSRLVMPLALAFGFGALLTSQAHAQVPGYSIKSKVTKNYTGGATVTGSFYTAGYISIPGSIGPTASIVDKSTPSGHVIGSAVSMEASNGSGGSIASPSSIIQLGTTSVEVIIRIHNPVGHPGTAFYTVGNYGKNYGRISAIGGALIEYNMLGLHGGLADSMLGPSGYNLVYSEKDPGYVEGPEQLFNSPCYYDADGHYVFRAYFSCGLSNSVSGTPGNPNQFNGVVYNASITGISYLKKIEEQTWATGSPEIFENLFPNLNNGVGTYNAPE